MKSPTLFPIHPLISGIMNAPKEAFAKTIDYIRICGGGMLIIVAYNLIYAIHVSLCSTELWSRSHGPSKKSLALWNCCFIFDWCVDVFHYILATPMSSILQLILCVGFMSWLRRREK